MAASVSRLAARASTTSREPSLNSNLKLCVLLLLVVVVVVVALLLVMGTQWSVVMLSPEGS
jgi:hypothetical protein